MGYYTCFDLSTKGNKTYKVSEIVSYMKKEYDKSDRYKYYPFEYNFDRELENDTISDLELYCMEEAKWYDHDIEMLELSKQFPEVVFCLYGDGEETEDIWYTYYKNGKSQYCPVKFVFDEYDESKLR